MELKLNVYNHGKVAKTYVASDFTLTTGLCEDALKLVDFDKLLASDMDQKRLGIEVLRLLSNGLDKFRPLFLDMFEGMTEEEFRNTSIKELAKVVIEVVNYSVNELNAITGNNEKN